jgi:hypothetical protein
MPLAPKLTGIIDALYIPLLNAIQVQSSYSQDYKQVKNAIIYILGKFCSIFCKNLSFYDI